MKKQPKEVLITGILGQDGSTMAEYILNNTNHNVIGTYRKNRIMNMRNVHCLEMFIEQGRFRMISNDVQDYDSLVGLVCLVKPDYIINFAGDSAVASSWENAKAVIETNTIGVLNCLEVIKRLRPKCRFFSAGSCEELGSPEYLPQDEGHPMNPESPYAVSKAAARNLVKVYRDSFRLYAVHGILFNHEGPKRKENFVSRKISKGVVRIKKEIESNKSILPIELGNLDVRRDWSDTSDFVDGIWRMLNQESYRGCILSPVFWQRKGWVQDYVLASGVSHSIREFVETAFQCVGIKGSWHKVESHLIIVPDSKFLETFNDENGNILVKVDAKLYRPADAESHVGDSSKIREQLFWEPRVTFEELVKKMVEHDLSLV